MSNTKILVVDDELHLVHILSYKLKQAGYDLVTAPNGRDGYELACQHKPALVVTDYQMPVVDGMEMAAKLLANADTADIPVIMLTARGHKIPSSDLAKTNIRSLMAKPLSGRELVANVLELIGPPKAEPTDGTAKKWGEGDAA